jgi:PIN domain nuclease of toxin-antitoxin system
LGATLVIVLDTHIWLWWVNGDVAALGSTRQQEIDESDVVAVSAISCFEVAWLDRHQRIKLPDDRSDWFVKALEGSGIVLLPITPTIAGIAVNLPEHHRDPQDRLIIATAIAHDADLMSIDSQFPKYLELVDRLR